MRIRLEYIQPGGPQQNAYVERFNRTVRYEWLSQYYWLDLAEVQGFISTYQFHVKRQDYSMKLNTIILCGGTGTRLWPLSRKSFPKQFIPLIEEKSLLELTIERVSSFSKEICLIASDEHRFLAVEALESANYAGSINASIILEPVPKNTAAAMALGAIKSESHPSPTLPKREDYQLSNPFKNLFYYQSD